MSALAYSTDDSDRVLVDSLQFIDSAIDQDEGASLAAMKEVDDELEIFPPEKDYLEHLPLDLESRTFCSSLLKAEHENLDRNQSKSSADDGSNILTRVPPHSGDDTQEDEMEIWQDCLNQLKIKIEYRQRQLVNMELLKTHNQSLWEQFLALQKDFDSRIENELNDLITKSSEITLNRRAQQERIAKTLDLLENEWRSLTKRNHALASEIKRMRYI